QNRRVEIFAFPDYDAAQNRESALTDGVPEPLKSAGSVGPVRFEARKGTLEQANSISTCLGQNSRFSVRTWKGKEATEEAARRVAGALLLHFATHGLYFPATSQLFDENNDDTWPDMSPILSLGKWTELPLYRSGLALAKANSAIWAWGE